MKTPDIQFFQTPRIPDITVVGGKAHSLIQSTKEGFPVPPGFVLTVAFFEPWIEEVEATDEWRDFLEDPTRERCDAIKAYCGGLTLDTDRKNRLESAMETLSVMHDGEGGGEGEEGKDDRKVVVAVRSSSPEEDLEGTSFAGGYETTLGVTPPSLQDAIVASFASAFDYRIVQYKNQCDIATDEPRIAIVVQSQIASDVSGVAFSLNPQNNCYDEAVVSANFGLGETVVAGLVTPDTYVADKVKGEIISKNVAEKELAYWLEDGGGMRKEKNTDPQAQALTDEKIMQVVSLAARVEEAQGRPVDIEWAIEDGKLYLLQSRPVTAYIPLFPEMLTPPGGEDKYLYLDLIVLTQGFSDPLSVLGMEIWSRMLEVAKPHITHGSDELCWEIHGREYLNLSNMAKCYGGRSFFLKMMGTYDAPTRRGLEQVNLDEYVPNKAPPRGKHLVWHTIQQMIRVLPSVVRAVVRGENSLDGYLKYTEEMRTSFHSDDFSGGKDFGELVDRSIGAFAGMMPHIGGIVVPMISRWRLHRMFAGENVEDLLVTLNMDLDGNPTSEMGHWMLRLASFPKVQETQTAEEFLKRLKDESYSSEFLHTYNEYMDRFGCRGMKEIDIATPRSYENLENFFGRLKQIDINHNAIKTVKERKEEAYRKLLALATKLGKEEKFKHHSNVIKKLGGYREHPKYMFIILVDMLRRRALKLGHEFVGEGRLKNVEQIFDLTVEQITEAESTPEMDLLSLVEKNTAPYQAVSHVKDWPRIVDSRGKIIRAPINEGEGGLAGDAISPGVVRGHAKVLHMPYEKKVQRGEILVARATEPSWTPIFINAAGVVLEVGGPLQHGAIIAREYGIPCVSGVENAMRDIQDGDLLEVDGSSGIVRIIEEMEKDEDTNRKEVPEMDVTSDE